MSKKVTKQTTEDTEAVAQVLSSELSTEELKKTYAVLPLKQGGYQVVEIEFNPNTVKVLRNTVSRAEANEAFKIAVAQSGMLG